jgi:hypothetical protein
VFHLNFRIIIWIFILFIGLHLLQKNGMDRNWCDMFYNMVVLLFSGNVLKCYLCVTECKEDFNAMITVKQITSPSILYSTICHQVAAVLVKLLIVKCYQFLVPLCFNQDLFLPQGKWYLYIYCCWKEKKLEWMFHYFVKYSRCWCCQLIVLIELVKYWLIVINIFRLEISDVKCDKH